MDGKNILRSLRARRSGQVAPISVRRQVQHERTDSLELDPAELSRASSAAVACLLTFARRSRPRPPTSFALYLSAQVLKRIQEGAKLTELAAERFRQAMKVQQRSHQYQACEDASGGPIASHLAHLHCLRCPTPIICPLNVLPPARRLHRPISSTFPPPPKPVFIALPPSSNPMVSPPLPCTYWTGLKARSRSLCCRGQKLRLEGKSRHLSHLSAAHSPHLCAGVARGRHPSREPELYTMPGLGPI